MEGTHFSEKVVHLSIRIDIDERIQYRSFQHDRYDFLSIGQ